MTSARELASLRAAARRYEQALDLLAADVRRTKGLAHRRRVRVLHDDESRIFVEWADARRDFDDGMGFEVDPVEDVFDCLQVILGPITIPIIDELWVHGRSAPHTRTHSNLPGGPTGQCGHARATLRSCQSQSAH